jgi:eukaryotic-like serine/threonine-protein kinase
MTATPEEDRVEVRDDELLLGLETARGEGSLESPLAPAPFALPVGILAELLEPRAEPPTPSPLPPRPTLPPLTPPPRSSRRPATLSDRFLQQPAGVTEKYRVERILGRGRLAVNAVVRHGELRQRFLLVHLRPDGPAYLDSLAGFLRGARGALQLTGEHVVRTVDAGRMSSGAPYVALEYPTGSSLKQVQRLAGPLGITDAVDHVLQATIALAEAHALGIHHGRLSAGHLFVTRRGDGSPLIKVLGFGIADALCFETTAEDDDLDLPRDPSSDAFAEPAMCMAPELLRHSREPDALSDVWSMGAVLHELLCGAPVFQATSPAALVAMIAADPPTPVTTLRSEVPAGLESIVLRCLAKDPGARFPSVGELAAALQPFASFDAQHRVERIVKTLVRSSIVPPPSSTSALVHVGSTPSVAPVAAPPAVARDASARLSWAVLTAGAALALGGAAMLGAGVATQRAQASPAARPAPVATAMSPVTAPVVSAVVPSAAASVSAAPARTWQRRPGVKYEWPPKPKASADAASATTAKPSAKLESAQPADALFDDTR